MKYLNELKNAIFLGILIFLISVCGCEKIQTMLPSDQPEVGETIALTQYGLGVDVIYAMVDQSGFGAVEAAKLAEGRYVIWNYIDITDAAPGIILTALRVGIDESAYSVIQEFAAGTLMAGVRSLGLAEDNVGYMLAEGNKALLSDELLEKVEALKAGIIAGDITVPMVPETNALLYHSTSFRFPYRAG